ncbi:hypothetical protein M758_4G200900 [Ceratodon purpureus]|nr:hypothetical protein M758_4G200900 [Ceratodon purpureus]
MTDTHRNPNLPTHTNPSPNPPKPSQTSNATSLQILQNPHCTPQKSVSHTLPSLPHPLTHSPTHSTISIITHHHSSPHTILLLLLNPTSTSTSTSTSSQKPPKHNSQKHQTKLT